MQAGVCGLLGQLGKGVKAASEALGGMARLDDDLGFDTISVNVASVVPCRPVDGLDGKVFSEFLIKRRYSPLWNVELRFTDISRLSF